MKRITMFYLVSALALVIGLATGNAMAQFTNEFILCQDGSSPDACRDTAIDPDPDGVVTWDLGLYGSTLCAGTGFEAQDADCTFTGAAYVGHDCANPALAKFQNTVPAGLDLFIVCADVSGLPAGAYSARATQSTCFDGQGVCGKFRLR